MEVFLKIKRKEGIEKSPLSLLSQLSRGSRCISYPDVRTWSDTFSFHRPYSDKEWAQADTFADFLTAWRSVPPSRGRAAALSDAGTSVPARGAPGGVASALGRRAFCKALVVNVSGCMALWSLCGHVTAVPAPTGSRMVRDLLKRTGAATCQLRHAADPGRHARTCMRTLSGCASTSAGAPRIEDSLCFC